MPVKLFHVLMSPLWKPISHWKCSMKNLTMVSGICLWQIANATAMIAKPKCAELTLWRHQSWEHINQLLSFMIWTSSKVSFGFMRSCPKWTVILCSNYVCLRCLGTTGNWWQNSSSCLCSIWQNCCRSSWTCNASARICHGSLWNWIWNRLSVTKTWSYCYSRFCYWCNGTMGFDHIQRNLTFVGPYRRINFVQGNGCFVKTRVLWTSPLSESDMDSPRSLNQWIHWSNQNLILKTFKSLDF